MQKIATARRYIGFLVICICLLLIRGFVNDTYMWKQRLEEIGNWIRKEDSLSSSFFYRRKNFSPIIIEDLVSQCIEEHVNAQERSIWYCTAFEELITIHKTYLQFCCILAVGCASWRKLLYYI